MKADPSKKKRHTILHPFLLACAPTLIFYGQNSESVELSMTLLPLMAGIVLATIGWLLLRIVARNWIRSGICTSLCLFAFFSFGPLRDVLNPILEPVPLGKLIYLAILTVWLLLVLFTVIVLIRSRRDYRDLSRILNVAGLALVILPFADLAIQTASNSAATTTAQEWDCTEMGIPNRGAEAELPDIYYIILDGFARADVNKNIYHQDQSDLLDYLKAHGFYIGSQSTANYCQTLLSLASSLNYTYMHGEDSDVSPPTRRTHLTGMIQDSRVGRIMSCLGYQTIACATGYIPSEMRSADRFSFHPPNPWRYGDFHDALMRTTLLPTILNRTNGLFGLHAPLTKLRAGTHQKRILHAYDVLTDLATDPTATFAFIHIIAPHPPFVFDADGPREELALATGFNDGDHRHKFDPEQRQSYIREYTEQSKFIETQTIKALEAILAADGPSPIIIIQSDHGPGSGLQWESVDGTDVRERLSILNAYHLPNGGDTLLYDTITPVNTFRVISRHYFGMNLETLPDRSYFSRWSEPFNFIDVTDQLAPAAD